MKLTRITGYALVLVFIAMSGALTGAALGLKRNPTPLVTTPPTGQWFDYVLNIMLENHSINFTYFNGGSVNSCIGNCTYFTSLANANGLALGLTNGNVNASTASYIAMTSGYGNAAQACNSGPNAAGCPYLQILNIVDRLESAGLTWKAYMEGYPQPPSGCFTNYNSGAPFYYTPNHNPFLYYADIVNSTARCARIVTANSQPVTQNSTGCWPSALQNDNVLINDLNSVTNASNYMWLTPNTLDQTHDCNDVSLGNAWLNKMVPQILSSTLFKTKRAALFITFDEPGCTNPAGQPPCPSPPSQDVYSVWASNPSNPTTRSSFKSTQSYLLYSPLKAVESNWGLSALTTNDATANSMSEFFAVLSTSFTYSPLSVQPGQQITFTASATGGASPYTFNWRFGDGGTATGGTVTHAYNTAGIYNAQLTVTDKLGAVKNATQSITVGPNFSISSNPPGLTLHTGSSNTSRIILSSINSFSGSVSLGTSVSPSGLTASLNFTSVNLVAGGNATSTLTVSSTTPATYSVNVTGTSGANSHTTTITVRVTTADFSISASPTSLTMPPSTNGTSMIQITSLNQFSGTVTLSAQVSQPGLVSSLSPQNLSLSPGGSATSTLTLSSLTYGNYTVTVTGVGGSLSHFATLTVRVFPSSVVVASDSALGTASLYTTGGQKLIQDSAGKMISVYVDTSGRISLSFDNTDPSKGGWSAPVKSALPTFAYSWPAAVLVSLTSIRVIAVGGSVSGGVVDIPITISRGSGNNVTGFSFGTATTLDSSGLSKYTAAILLHNNDILAAWGWENTTTSIVKSLRWDQNTGWTNLSGSSTLPDNAFVDTSIIQYFVPNMIERPDNHNIYLFALRFVSSGRLAFDKASWNGLGWSWGSQNLTYETGASDADDDAIGLSWDPSRSLVVAEYGISGTHTYGVFTLTAADVKTHIDTPTLAVAGDRGWGAIGVQTNTGDYYLFLISVNTDVGSGTLGYIRMPSGGSWNATIAWLNTATDNQVTSLRMAGPGLSLDLLYVEGTSSPANLKFVRLGAPSYTIIPNPTSLAVLAGSTATSTISLSSLYNFAGTITLSATVSLSGAVPTLSPATVTLASGSTVTSNLSFNPTAAGFYTITILATSGILFQSTTVAVTVFDFNVTSNLNSITVNAGTTGTSTIIVTALNGLTGTVTLSVSASSPSGLSCALPASVTFGMSPQTATLSCSATAAGTYTAQVTGVDGILTHQTGTISFVVVDFSISSGAISPTQTLAGASGTSTITITASNGLAGPVSLSVSASTPAGLSCTLSPTSVTFGNSPQISILTCTSGTANTYTVTVTGTDGTLSHATTAITFVVVDFTISASATPAQVLAGATGTSIIAVGAVNGLTGSVSLTVSASTPAGLTCVISPMIATFGLSPQTATLTCSGAVAGDYMVTVMGTSGTLAHTTSSILFHIVDFSISAGVVSPQILPGNSGTSTITVAALNGLTGTVNLAVSTSTPAGLTCIVPPSVNLGSSPETGILSCTSAIANNYNVTVTGSDGMLTHASAEIIFKVVDFTIAASTVAPSQILAGAFGNSTIVVSAVNGLTGIVTLSVSPSSLGGLTCTLPASVTFGSSPQTSTLTCGSPVANTYTVTVTGTDGPVSHTVATITFIVVDFSIVAGPVSPNQVLAGGFGSSSISATALNGMTGTVSLAVSLSTPAGLSCNLTPTSIIFGASPQSSSLSCTSGTANAYNITVIGTGGPLSRTTATITFVVVDFTIVAGSTSAQLLAGASGTSTISLAAVNGLTGTIALAVSVSTPAGLTCTLPPSVTLGVSPQTTTLSCSSSIANSYIVMVTGTDGVLSHSAPAIPFIVVDFSIATGIVSPLQTLAGTASNSTVTVTGLNGFTGIVNLTTNSTNCTLSTTALTGAGSSAMSCGFAIAGTVSVVVTGSSGSLFHQASVTFIVQDFAIVSSPSTNTVLTGSAGISTIIVTPLNGFSGFVNLSTNSTLCTLSPAGLTGAGNSTVSCSFASAATIHVLVTGIAGPRSQANLLTFIIQDYNINISTTATSVNVSAIAASSIAIGAINGFSGLVSLSTNSTACTISPASVTGSGGASLSCSFSTVQTTHVIVTSQSASLSHSVAITFIVQDFTLTASSTGPTNVNFASNSTITLNALNQFSGTMTLSEVIPPGLLCGPITPGTLVASGIASVSCTAVSPGNYSLNITATSASLVHTIALVFSFQDYQIAAVSPAASSVFSSVLSIVTITSQNAFSGAVNLSDAVPSGLTCDPIAPSSIVGAGSAVLSCSSGAAGNYTITITASSTTLTHSTTIVLSFGDFSLAAQGPAATPVGLTSSSTISVTAINHYSGAVFLSDSASVGLTCLPISPSSLTGSGTALVSCNAASVGNYTLQIFGTAGSLQRASSVVIQVSDIGLSASSSVVTTYVGGSPSLTIGVTSINGYSGTVQTTAQSISPVSTGTNGFGAGGHVTYLVPLPPALTFAADPGSQFITSGGTGRYTLTITVPFGMPAANYTIIITASDGEISHSTQVKLVVTDFTFTTQTNIVSIGPGNNATLILNLQSLNGFQGNLTLSSIADPLGLTALLNPSSILLAGGANTTLTIIVPSGISAGNYTLTVMAIMGTVSHSISITVQVQPTTSGLLAALHSGGTATTGIADLLALALILPYSIHDRRPMHGKRKQRLIGPAISPQYSRIPPALPMVVLTNSWLPFPIRCQPTRP